VKSSQYKKDPKVFATQFIDQIVIGLEKATRRISSGVDSNGSQNARDLERISKKFSQMNDVLLGVENDVKSRIKEMEVLLSVIAQKLLNADNSLQQVQILVDQKLYATFTNEAALVSGILSLVEIDISTYDRLTNEDVLQPTFLGGGSFSEVFLVKLKKPNQPNGSMEKNYW